MKSWKDQIRICDYDKCNNTFAPKKWNQRFCCPACRVAYWNGPPFTPVEKKCEQCNKPYTKWRSWMKYCTTDCKRKAINARRYSNASSNETCE